MSATNENHEPTAIDDLHDRLVDRGLTEIVGRETVPNLSARILAAAVPTPAAKAGAARPAAQPAAPRTRPTRAFWASLAVAATLLVAAGVYYSSAFQQHESTVAAVSAKAQRLELRGATKEKDGSVVDQQHSAQPAQSTLATREQLPNYSTDLNVPFRQGSFDASQLVP